jgi:hypothetical protein
MPALLDRFGRIKLMCVGMVCLPRLPALKCLLTRWYQTGAACAIAVEAALVAKLGGTDNAVGNAFGILFLFIFITIFAGGMDACKYFHSPSQLITKD